MKKILVFLLLLCLCLGLCACTSMDKMTSNLRPNYEIETMSDQDLEDYAILLALDLDDYNIVSAIQATHKTRGTGVVIVECDSKNDAAKLAKDAADIVEMLEYAYGTAYTFDVKTDGCFALFGETAAITTATGKASSLTWEEKTFYTFDDTITWCIIGSIVFFAFHITFCWLFATIAEDKGYPRGRNFLLCFFFGVIGFLMVAAKPSIAMQKKLSLLEERIDKLIVVYNADTPNSWTCKNCGEENSIQHKHCRQCGHSKFIPARPATHATHNNDIATTIPDSWVCHNCGEENSITHSQCKRCGQFKT